MGCLSAQTRGLSHMQTWLSCRPAAAQLEPCRRTTAACKPALVRAAAGARTVWRSGIDEAGHGVQVPPEGCAAPAGPCVRRRLLRGRRQASGWPIILQADALQLGPVLDEFLGRPCSSMWAAAVASAAAASGPVTVQACLRTWSNLYLAAPSH